MHKILLVEDEDMTRKAIERMIDWSSLDCEVVASARNGYEAWQCYLDKYPDIIITDLMMPVMDGLEFIELVRKTDSEAKVVVLSGYEEFSYAQKAIRLGAKDYLLKPVSVADMKDIVSRCAKELDEERKGGLDTLRGSVEYTRTLLMELVNDPQNIDATLERYLGPEVLSAGGAMLATAPLQEGGERSILRYLDSLATRDGLELLMRPLCASSTLYAIYHMPDINTYRLVSQQLEEEGRLAISFHGSTSETIHRLLASVSSSKLLTTYDRSGRPRSFSNEAGYIHWLGRMGQNLMQLISAQDGQENLEAIRRTVGEISLEDAKSILLRLVSSDTGWELSEDAMRVILNASDSQDILDFLLRAASRQVVASPSQDSLSYPVRFIKDYVDKNYSDPMLSLKSIASSALFMDAGYLSRLFHKETGVKFSDYVNQYRVDKACELMRMYHNSLISDIAEEVGFGHNPRYFSQVFKKYAGQSPSDFIKSV